MPAIVEVVGDLADGLVQFAQSAPVGAPDRPHPDAGRILRVDEAAHAAQEAALRRRRSIRSTAMSFSGGAANSTNRRHVSAPYCSTISSGLDHVALRLRHLRAVLAHHHALREQVRRRLVILDQPDIAHHLGEEARIDQVQNRVLDAADVLIDRKPLRDLRRIERRRAVVRIAVAVEIPGRIDERVHGVASRGAHRRRTWDTSRSRTTAHRPAATVPCR